MEALMAALVAALLVRASDPSADMVAIAAERSRRPGITVLVVLLTLALTQTIAAIGGWLVGSHLTPNAARLLFGLALLMAGGGALWPRKPLKTVAPGVFATAATLVANGIGDRTMFATFAVAAGGSAVLAGIGGAIGGIAVLAAVVVAGDALWRQRPRRTIDYSIGIVLLIAGAWLALSGLRLV